MNMDDEFYVGYDGAMPARTRRAVIGAIVVALTSALAAALLFVSQQRDLADARFEFGRSRAFEGYLSLTPSPVLFVRGRSALHPHWLVSPGKFGPERSLRGASSGWVTLSGTLIDRDPWRMIEVEPGSVRAVAARGAPPDGTPPRYRVLRGEIVDSKCFLGVMNPGERTVHRDCAARCIAGGVPPMLAYRDEAGPQLALLLGASDAVLRQVGNAVTLSGLLSGSDEAQVFTIGVR